VQKLPDQKTVFLKDLTQVALPLGFDARESCRFPFDFAQGRLSASPGMTKGTGRFHSYLMLDEQPQVPPLRYAPVGMTVLLQNAKFLEKSSISK
jgi:hypothetical protein